MARLERFELPICSLEGCCFNPIWPQTEKKMGAQGPHFKDRINVSCSKYTTFQSFLTDNHLFSAIGVIIDYTNYGLRPNMN